MTFTLSSNFLKNARGLTLTDSGGITWAFNKNTNSITASYQGSAAWPINTGWGTPVGGSVANNFTAGSGVTMAQATAVIAELIAVLKSVGIIGA